MKLRLVKRWRSARLPQTPKTKHKTDVDAKQSDGSTALPPRSIGNPYGRLFTQDKSFADLLANKRRGRTEQVDEIPTVLVDCATLDRTANTALTAPEKQTK